MKIDKPGIYDIPAEVYHADPCPTPSLSASLIKVLIEKTPLHAWTKHPRLNPNFEREENAKFDIGNSAHSMILRDPKDFAVLDFGDYKSKAAQAARDAARADGRIPLLVEQYERVCAMVQAAREQMDNALDFEGVFKNGKPEQTLIWCEGEGKDALWFRSRLDWLPDDPSQPYYDYKTSEISDPVQWVRSIMLKVGHDISAAFYRRGIRALGLNRQPKMRFIVQEPSEPFALSGVECGGEIIELADREIERAIAKWRLCRTMGYWPSYPAKFYHAPAPQYLETNRMEREVQRDEQVRDLGGEREAFAASFRRQAPRPMSKDEIL